MVRIYPCLGEGSPTKIDYGKKATLIPTSLLEDLGALTKRVSPGLGRRLLGPGGAALRPALPLRQPAFGVAR